MKRFIVKAFIFIAFLGAIVALWEHELGHIKNSYTKKRAQLESQLPSIQVLILGNSQTNQGINPALLSLKGYNLADVSQSLFYDKELTLKYLDRLPALKLVIINVSYVSLWFEDDHIEEWRKYFYYQYWGIKHPSLKWTDLSLYSKILIYSPRLPLSDALKGFHVDLAPNIASDGWGYTYGHIAKADTGANAKPELIDINTREVNLALNCQYLDTLITKLQARHINIAVITTPICKAKFRYMDTRKVTRTDSVMKVIVDKYNVKYFNYLQDSRFADSDYNELIHLNVAGAIKLSKILNEDLILKDSTLSILVKKDSATPAPKTSGEAN